MVDKMRKLRKPTTFGQENENLVSARDTGVLEASMKSTAGKIKVHFGLKFVAADTLNMNAAAISTFKKRQNFVKALGAVVKKVPAINARAENATWEETEMMLIPKCKNEKLLARYHGAFVL